MLSPIALHIGPLSVHWYGILYVVGLFLGIWVLLSLNKKRPVFKHKDQIFDLAFWVFLIGVMVGGRLGYVLFYDLSYYLQNPLKIFAIWEGGMSFHGGLIVSAIVCYFFFKKHKISFLAAGDLVVIPAALGQGIGRIGNFINRELVGRPIHDHRWDFLSVDFGDGVLRYPSPLFQAAELFILFLILLFLFSRHPKKGTLIFSYLSLNGLFRFISEFWREPDAQIGFVVSSFTMGQLFGILTLLAGLTGLFLIYKKGRTPRAK